MNEARLLYEVRVLEACGQYSLQPCESPPPIGILLSSCWTHKTYHHYTLLINVPPSKALCLSTVWEVKPHTHTSTHTKHFDTAECITQQVNKQFLPLQTGHDKGFIFLILLTDLAVWLRNRPLRYDLKTMWNISTKKCLLYQCPV